VVSKLSLLVLVLLVAGSAPARAAGDVTLHTARLQLGSLELRDVSVVVHDRGHGYETCVSANIRAAHLDACGSLTTVNGQLLVERGHAELVIPGQDWDGATLAQTTVSADVSGNLSRLELRLRGTARTALVDLHAGPARAMLRELDLPFAVLATFDRVELKIGEEAPLIVRVGGATLSAVGASVDLAPTITLHAGWPRWQADVAWSGVELGPVLDAASGGRLAGTGALDGQLAFRGDGANVTLIGGHAAASDGELRLADATWRDRLAASARDKDLAIHRRVAATLADFAYSRLTLAFGADPTVQISINGRGKRVAQDLDLVVNVRSQP